MSPNKFNVNPTKSQKLYRKMAQLDIRESDLIEKFVKGSGRGGQKINKTSNCVYLRHNPSGIEVKCQRERSRALNRFFARRMLIEKIETKRLQKKSKKQKEIAKKRKQKRKRSKRAKEKVLKQKKIRSQKKKARQKIDIDNENYQI
jgi:protein subunit release factor B